MEGVLEQQRKLHEERERLEDAIVKEKALKKSFVSSKSDSMCCLSSILNSAQLSIFPCTCDIQVRDRINSEHRMRSLVERSVTCVDKLLTLYDDKDG